MLVCKVLRIGSDKAVEKEINNFLSSLSLSLEDVRLSHSEFKGRLLVTILYNAK